MLWPQARDHPFRCLGPGSVAPVRVWVQVYTLNGTIPSMVSTQVMQGPHTSLRARPSCCSDMPGRGPCRYRRGCMQ